MKFLTEAASICVYVGKHFKLNSEQFKQLSKTETGKELAEEPHNLTTDVGAKLADDLAKKKEFLESYHRTMSIVSNSYNFQAVPFDQVHQQPLDMQSRLLVSLGIELKI